MTFDRAEHDFLKTLSHNFCLLKMLLKYNVEALKIIDEMIEATDNHYSKAKTNTREED